MEVGDLFRHQTKTDTVRDAGSILHLGSIQEAAPKMLFVSVPSLDTGDGSEEVLLTILRYRLVEEEMTDTILVTAKPPGQLGQ